MTARDSGVQPLVATATVTVVVLDLPDESPKFSKSTYESNVPENTADFFVAQVQVGLTFDRFFISLYISEK